MTDKPISGRQILLMQEAEKRQVIIDCSLAMRPAWEAAFREAAKGYQQIADALDAHDIAKPSGM
jgi:hypothetical protein